MTIILGINSDEESCQCCGRAGLKRVVWLGDTDGNIKGHYGTTCAAKMIGLNSGTKAQVERAMIEKQEIDKLQARNTFYKNCCIVLEVPQGKVFIEKGYRIGLVMKENNITRTEAVDLVKSKMKKDHWFLK